GSLACFGRVGPPAATARPPVAPAATLLITLGGIQSQQVLSNRTGCLLGFRPNSRLIARHPLLLVHVRLDQARIDRKTLTANQPGRHAPRHHALKHPAQGIALTETLVPRSAEHRMIGDLVLDADFAKPPVGKIHLNFSTNPSL